MQVLEVRTLARTPWGIPAFFPLRHFDLDDIGAPIGQLTHGRGPGADPRQIKHGKTSKSLGGPCERHLSASPAFRAANFSRTFSDLWRLVHRGPRHRGFLPSIASEPRLPTLAWIIGGDEFGETRRSRALDCREHAARAVLGFRTGLAQSAGADRQYFRSRRGGGYPGADRRRTSVERFQSAILCRNPRRSRRGYRCDQRGEFSS